MTAPKCGSAIVIEVVIFDLDGVLTDTAELHFQSWLRVAEEIDVVIEETVKDQIRGPGRMESLEIVLGERSGEFSDEQKAELAVKKNRYYVKMLESMTPEDALPGVVPLLRELRQRGISTAVASSSRNAGAVVDRLQIRPLLNLVVDGSQVEHTKPDPEVFLLAAKRLGVAPERCVVVEDAEKGVEAALSAGMRVVGIGPPERVENAHLVVDAISDLTADQLLNLGA